MHDIAKRLVISIILTSKLEEVPRQNLRSSSAILLLTPII